MRWWRVLAWRLVTVCCDGNEEIVMVLDLMMAFDIVL